MLANRTRRWMRRQRERLVDRGTDRGSRPAWMGYRMGRSELPPQTFEMRRLGVDRASMAQGGKP